MVTQHVGLWARGRGFDGRLGLNDEDGRHVSERVGAGALDGARLARGGRGWLHTFGARAVGGGVAGRCLAGEEGLLRRVCASSALAICLRPLYRCHGSRPEFLAFQPHASHFHALGPMHHVKFRCTQTNEHHTCQSEVHAFATLQSMAVPYDSNVV